MSRPAFRSEHHGRPSHQGRSPALTSSSAPTEKPAVVATDPPADEPATGKYRSSRPPVDENAAHAAGQSPRGQPYLRLSNRNLEFVVEEDSGATVIVVRDAEGEVIRRIPGEEVLQLMRRLNADSGTLIDSRA